MTTTTALLDGSPYVSYAYAYPHKTAYRALEPVVSLRDIWRRESRDALFLYMHVPFCEQRCGFCNLFTTTSPRENLVSHYLAALRRQAAAVREALGDAHYAQMAVGGGTPTFLDETQLAELLDLARSIGADPADIPASVEVSPATATHAKVRLLRDAGVSRISIGVQTFDTREAKALGRTQPRAQTHDALTRIADAAFATLNIDLIYGGAEQTEASWLGTLESALQYAPQELYLYPLYVRPLRGLGKRGCDWDDHRLRAYRAGRDLLLSRGWSQVSMRMFRAPANNGASHRDPLAYCCQSDGMVGLGCGARSYTRSLHYSDNYAVERAGVMAIIRRFATYDSEHFRHADHGFVLDDAEQRRRFVIMSLLQCEGLDRRTYADRFQSEVLDDLPMLAELRDAELAIIDSHRITLTESGVERSDAIGPWLTSPAVKERMEEYAWR